MPRDSNASEMEALVLKYDSLGGSKTSFAIAHGISDSKFHYWYRKLSRLKAQKPDQLASDGFVPLHIKSDVSDPTRHILIRLSSGIEIKIPI